VIAQYVRVTEDGKNVRLADLDPLPSNVPGEATGVSTTQPTAPPSTAEFLRGGLQPQSRRET
jgi:hypothetical protein